MQLLPTLVGDALSFWGVRTRALKLTLGLDSVVDELYELDQIPQALRDRFHDPKQPMSDSVA